MLFHFLHILSLLRSHFHVLFTISYFVIFTSSSSIFPSLLCACLCGRAFTWTSGNILFTPFSLSSLNSAARLSARFLFFFFSLKSHEPPGLFNRSKLFLSFSFIFGFWYHFFSKSIINAPIKSFLKFRNLICSICRFLLHRESNLMFSFNLFDNNFI